MNKRGISAIVATVLVILITVAGIGIIWVAIVPMISESIVFDALEGRVSVVSAGGYTLYDSSREVAMVQIKRDVDDGVMDRIKVSFLIEGNSVSSNVVAPESGAVKVYSFDLSGLGVPESVEVAPIFVSGSSEKVGSVTSNVDLGSGMIENSDGGAYEMGRDYFYDMPTTGLISWWKFDGDFDDSAGGNNGVQGGGSDADANSDVLVLDGVGDYIGVGDIGIPLNGPASISGWFNFDILASERVQHLRLYNVGGSSLFYQNSGNDYLYIGSDYFVAGASLSKNFWHHIVFTYSDDTSTAKLYIDSNVYNIGLNGGPDDIDPLDNFQISAAVDSFDGAIDNVMIFDRVLSEEEVNAIYEVQGK